MQIASEKSHSRLSPRAPARIALGMEGSVKKLTTALLTILTLLILTGCNNDKKDVTAAAEGFLTALVNNDREAASQYATEEFMKGDVMKMIDPQYLSDSFYEAMGVSKDEIDEEAQKVVDEYVNQIVEKAYKDYEIQDVKVQDEKAAVTVRITLGYDPEASNMISEDTKELISAYQTEHYDELISLYKDEGEKAMYRKLYSDLIPIVVGKMKEQLESGESAEEKTILSLEKIDKTWLVTDLEENRAGANAAGTMEEAAAAATTSSETAAEGVSSEYAEAGATSEYASEYATEAPAEAEEPGEGDTAGEYSSSEDSSEADTQDGGENS